MRIAYVCGDPGIPVLGDKGAAVHVRELVGGFTSVGHHVTVVAARTGNGPREDLAASLHAMAADAQDTSPDGPRDARSREWTYARRNHAWQVALDARHAHVAFDLVYERYSLWMRAGAAFARRHGLPYVVEVNSPLRDEQRTYRELAWDVRATRVERLVFNSATKIIAVSHEVAAYVRTRTSHHDRVQVVENGVDLSRYHTAPSFARSDTFRIGFLGSLKPWHGVDVLLAAAARLRPRLPEMQVVIVGDGPERASLARQAQEAGVSDVVEFVGPVPKRDVPTWLASMDVVTAPYPPLDGFYFSPLKIYDYLAAGRPIVASDVGQISGVLRDGDTALLVAAGNVEALAAAILRVQQVPGLAERLGRAGRAEAIARHGWDRRARTILSGLGSAGPATRRDSPVQERATWRTA